MSDEERSELVSNVGVVASDPDGGDVGLLRLEPGEYVAVCALPIGGEDAAPDAPPHAAEGMIQEFTVE